MRISLCTITFRHQLVSLEDIALWARAHDFQGIELWGVHARNLAGHPCLNAAWLHDLGLTVSMVSDYLPTEGDKAVIERKAHALSQTARDWRARKIRTFAGTRGSLETRDRERARVTEGLRRICHIVADEGQELLVETHPNTLADCAASTLQLITEVDHPALKINFDALHVWEGGDDLGAAHEALLPHIRHYHLKNIRSRADLALFEPSNVYAASGRRDGMTPLFSGKVDYVSFLTELAVDPAAEASLEWFGDDAFDVLARDRGEIARVMVGRSLGVSEAVV
ncbi:3-dehydroshikimate dehydratase [Agaricicola taiwanensis]|uniref:3-dehydroshikimate dehydratase n=1 Tax=Agaricicola taiwanensis TaxID=591372 RepID=A0A8J3DXL7_9RHOB|nr:sugar phosphate isomerase/epimerase [Agaricicola taiwanensis]GGE48616.1 3-dehydroshikimate dehydratase [Agaricicola taiwanensis]